MSQTFYVSDQHDRLWKKLVSIGKNSTSPNTPTRSAFAPFPSPRGHSCGNWIFNDVFFNDFWGFPAKLSPNAKRRFAEEAEVDEEADVGAIVDDIATDSDVRQLQTK